MKRCRSILIWIIPFLLPIYAFSQPPAPQSTATSSSMLGNLRVSLLRGDVQIKTAELADWAAASINMPLKEEDELWVPEAARLEIQILPATYVRLDQNSSLSVMTLTRGAEQVYLTQGRAYINFNPGRGGMIQFDTPISSIQVFGRGVFKVDVTEQGYTEVSVLDGTVYVEGKSGKTTVESGNVLSLQEGSDADLAPLGPGDDWEDWNVERDKRVFARREAGQHLPEELQGYSSDLDSNGKWVYVKGYGQVWTPTVGVAAEWSPYRVGRWTWIGGDYVWVSYEPWGWAPYHYGRWGHVPGIGWFWVPPPAGGVYWGPGYVSWVNTPSYVAWVPLASREVYYGYGYFGPYSVDLRRVNVNSVRVTNTYRNIRVNNSVTIVSNDTFLHGHGWGGSLPDSPLSYTDTRFKGNPFLENRIHPGRPLIKPVRNSMISINREISINRHPPQRIRDMNISSIRETRHIAQDHDVSAFSPGAVVRPLKIRTKEGSDVRKGAETRKVVGPGGETRPGGMAPGGREMGEPGDRKIGIRPGDRDPRPGELREGSKPGDRGSGYRGPGVKPENRGPGLRGPREGVRPGDKRPADRRPGVKPGGRGPGSTEPREGVKPGERGPGGPDGGRPGDSGPEGGGPRSGADKSPGGGGPAGGGHGDAGHGGAEPQADPTEKSK